MIRINVALEIKHKSDSAILVGIAATVLFCCGIGYYAPSYYADMVTAEAQEKQTLIEEKKSQLQKLKVDVEKVKSLQERLAELKSRANRIRALSQGRKQPVLLLDVLQGQHLDRMWFTKLNMAGNNIRVQGYALDHAVIAEYVRRLKMNVNGQSEGDVNDLKDFIPHFMQGESISEEIARTESVFPITISDVKLSKSTADTKESVLVQSFDINFTANMR